VKISAAKEDDNPPEAFTVEVVLRLKIKKDSVDAGASSVAVVFLRQLLHR
jgi:hypothetical protein